ncbi:MAG: hypothetical protein ACR2FZ_00490 [Thermoleophilaceae bacterium]
MLRPLLAALAIAAALAPPAAASTRQLSIMQDDAAFLGISNHDPEQAMAEAKALGADVVRTFVVWKSVSPQPESRQMPPGFDPGNPDSPGYDWSFYDAFIDRARRAGLKVFLTLAPPQPYWASEQPEACPHHVAGNRLLVLSCMWKPDPVLFGQFAHAVARRYGARAAGSHGGSVILYSMWNEPNLEHYLFPQLERIGGRTVDTAAKRYRRLWFEGWKAISISDPSRRNNVLFGEAAAISSPIDTLNAALCLDEKGRPFRGRMRRLQGCVRPRTLPIGGVAIHPYNDHAGGTVFTRSFSPDSVAASYVPRVHRVMDRAARLGRIPAGRGVYLTEFGFQTNPPDTRYGLSPKRHAAAINEADRLYYADPRVKATSQFELYDVPSVPDEDPAQEVYTTGLRYLDGSAKPALEAYRLPLVVSRRSREDEVEVWGQVRPARGPTIADIMVSPQPGGPFTAAMRVRTSRAGYFQVLLRRKSAARLHYRLRWRSPDGTLLHSRKARAGRPIRYLG